VNLDEENTRNASDEKFILTLVSDDVWFMKLFMGVPWRGVIKEQESLANAKVSARQP